MACCLLTLQPVQRERDADAVYGVLRGQDEKMQAALNEERGRTIQALRESARMKV